MTISFLRPIGASADVKEFEYVSALHQTDTSAVRMDGSIRDLDIVRFLSSRYGICVTPSDVRKTVMHGLGGGDDEEECIDLMEMVAILLIPTLVKAAGQNADEADEEQPCAREDFVNECEYNRYQQRRALFASLTPHKSLLKYVLQMILHDVTGTSSPKSCNRDLVRQIFISYGEIELAKDDRLLDDMVAAVKGCSCGSVIQSTEGGTVEASGCECNVMLDKDAFARALSSDVLLYDVESEMRCTNTYYDVFKTQKSSHKSVQPSEVEQEGSNDQMTEDSKTETRPVRKIWTASSIDFAAATYRLKLLVISLWAAFVITYFAYYYTEFNEGFYQDCIDYSEGRGEAFGCRVLMSIVRWFIIFVSVSVMGLLFVGLGSLGNNIESENKIMPLVGLIAVAFQIIFPYTDERISKDPEDMLLYQASLFLGCWVMSLQFYNFVGRIVPRSFLETRPRLERFFVPGGNRAESHTKQAAAHKMNAVTKNALDIVSINDPDNLMRTHYGQALLTYSKMHETFEPVGGFTWSWRKIFNKELFKKEGIWIPARFLAGNVAMVIVSAFVLMSGINLTQQTIRNYGKDDVEDVFDIVFDVAFGNRTNINANDMVATALSETGFFELVRNEDKYGCLTLTHGGSNITNMACTDVAGWYECQDTNASYICTQLPENATERGIGMSSFEGAMKAAVYTTVEKTMDSFYPEEQYMIVVPLIVGTCVAFLASVALTVIYIPSITSTILQLRSGVIPTFRDQANFGKHRFGAELVTILLGSLVWGSLLSSILVGGIVGVILFVLLWQVTEEFTLRFLAFLCGMTVVIIFRVLILLAVRTKLYEAFYRPKPARANIIALVLEASNFALSFGFIIVRSVKLLLVSAFYIGRIDTPFLAPGVGNPWGYFELDNYPTIFIKDMLAHDAHRHPFIELLGTMYMLKLRHGEHFGSRAGSCWRLIFVFALMPWLSKYRIMTRPDMRGDTENVTSERSSIDFISLYRNLVPSDALSLRQPGSKLRQSQISEQAGGRLEDESLSATGLEQNNEGTDTKEVTADEMADEMPSFASVDEKALWLEGKNALLELEVAELKRRLLLMEMKVHRRSSLPQLKT